LVAAAVSVLRRGGVAPYRPKTRENTHQCRTEDGSEYDEQAVRLLTTCDENYPAILELDGTPSTGSTTAGSPGRPLSFQRALERLPPGPAHAQLRAVFEPK
jgi:hypothetical protein